MAITCHNCRDVMWFAKQGEATRNWWQFWAIARLCCRRGVCFPNNQNMMGTAATRMTKLLTRAYGTMCTTCTICVPTQQERLDRDACGGRKQIFIIFWVCCLCNMTSKNIPKAGRDTPFWRLLEYWAGVLAVKRVPGTQCLFDHSWCQVLSAPGLEARRFHRGGGQRHLWGLLRIHWSSYIMCNLDTWGLHCGNILVLFPCDPFQLSLLEAITRKKNDPDSRPATSPSNRWRYGRICPNTSPRYIDDSIGIHRLYIYICRCIRVASKGGMGNGKRQFFGSICWSRLRLLNRWSLHKRRIVPLNPNIETEQSPLKNIVLLVSCNLPSGNLT